MEDFHAEDLNDIISIQIHLQQYGNDFKWMWVTHGVFTKCFTLLDKENCAPVIHDTLRSLFTNEAL